MAIVRKDLIELLDEFLDVPEQYRGKVYYDDWNTIMPLVCRLGRKGYYHINNLHMAILIEKPEELWDWIIISINHYNKKKKEANEDTY